MSDITKCADSKCPSRLKCYRFTAKSNPYWQSFGAFGREKCQKKCDDFLTQPALRSERITIKEYNEKMAQVIAMGRPVTDTLIALLEEAGKCTLKGAKPSKSGVFASKKKQSSPRGYKK